MKNLLLEMPLSGLLLRRGESDSAERSYHDEKGRLSVLERMHAHFILWKLREDPRQLRDILKEASRHDGPALVDVISQPLHEANAPVSEWIA